MSQTGSTALLLPAVIAAREATNTPAADDLLLLWQASTGLLRSIRLADLGGGGLTGEQVDARVASLLVAGSNVTLTYDDPAGTLTIAAAAGGGGLTLDQVDAHLAVALIDGIGIDITYDDVAHEFRFDRLERLHDDADAPTIVIDLAADVGEHHEFTLGGDRNLAIVNATRGQKFRLKINQDSTGGRSVTWFPGITWVNGYEPAQTPVPSSGDTFEFLTTNAGGYGDTFLGWILSTERAVMRVFATVAVPINERQRISSVAVPTGGTWTITSGSQTTSALAHNATAASVQAAMESLSSVGSGNVQVTGGTLGVAAFVIEFVGGLSGQDVPPVTVQSSLVF